MLGMLALGYLSFLVLIFIHELGHLVAAKLVGIRIRKFIVGGGFPFQFSAGGLLVSLRPLPTHGLVVPEFSPDIFSFGRQVFFISGGLIAQNVFLVFVYWHLFTQWPAYVDEESYWKLYLELAVLLFGTVTVVKNFVPGTAIVEGQSIPNDGLSFWQNWKDRSALAPKRRQMEKLQHICREFESGKSKDIAIPLESISHEFGGDCILMIAMAWQAMEQKRFDLARAIFEGVAKLKSISPVEKVSALDGLASMVIYHERWELLGEAEAWIKDARLISSDQITLDGTLGGILVDSGRPAEAKAMLANVFKTSKSVLDLAISAAYLAKVAHSEGNIPEAKNWLKKACAYGTHHVVVNRIKKQIA